MELNLTSNWPANNSTPTNYNFNFLNKDSQLF